MLDLSLIVLIKNELFPVLESDQEFPPRVTLNFFITLASPYGPVALLEND